MTVAAATETPLVPKWETTVESGILHLFPSISFDDPERFKV